MDSNIREIKEGAVTKKKQPNKFNLLWLDEKIFKQWLAPQQNNIDAICKVCEKTISCKRSNLIRHSQSVSHTEKISKQDQSLSENNDMSLTNKIKRAEIKLAAFFAEHNIALNITDHLIPLLKDVCAEPNVVESLSLGKTKCTKIITEIIAKRESEKLIDILKKQKFSILVDESTDITDTKHLCVLVQYLCPLDKKVKTKLLELLAIDARDGSANAIFQTFKNFLEEKEIPIQNIVGMASDNAAVMIGCNNSFFSRLKSEVPRVVLLNCICHSSAIIASKACTELPEICEKLIRDVASYISGSAKRCAILREFQEFFNEEKHKILKLANTRWLVLEKCVVRLLENWDILKHFFTLAALEEKSQSADNILILLNDNEVKAYFLFLKYIFNFFNTFNAFFQSRKVLIHKLHHTSQQFIQQIGRNFLTPEALKDIATLNVDDNKNIKTLNDVYVGPECKTLLNALPLERAQEIRLNCLAFYKTAFKELLKRLHFKDSFFEQLSFLDPEFALFDDDRNKFEDLSGIATRIGSVDLSKLAYEWRILPTICNELKKKELASLSIDEMWKIILETENFAGQKFFPNLESLVETVLSFPHSNAEAERIFSIVTDVKNKKRNRLTGKNLSAICIIRSTFNAENITCTNFEVDNRHLELHNTQNIYSRSSGTSDGL